MKWLVKSAWAGLFVIGLGLVFRFWNLNAPHFVFYDEGLYLAHNIRMLYLLEAHPPQGITEWIQVLEAFWHAALADTKTLWFFLVSSRGFFCGVDCFLFPVYLSAFFGALTIPVLYYFGKRFYDSRFIGLLAAVLLAILPSHVFYSRLGMQEGLSALCLTLGFYFYLTSSRWLIRSLVSGLWFGCVFFTNYRMVIIPFLLFGVEGFFWFKNRSFADWKRWLYTSIVFALMVFGIGSLDDGANTRIAFGWMFHQAQISEGTFAWFNLLSYPFYQFYLESPFWGILFIVQGIWVFRSLDRKAVLWFVVLMMMVIFSLPQEKGVRYLCVVMPLLCLSSAAFLESVWMNLKNNRWRLVLASLIVLMFGWHLAEDWRISGWTTDYLQMTEEFKKRQSVPLRVSSSQPVLMSVLAGKDGVVVKPAITLQQCAVLYQKGFRYLVLDPQAYVSYTNSGQRFDSQLTPFLEFVKRTIDPIAVYPHFSKRLLTRFVLEHNENLHRSWQFIHYAKTHPVNELYVYDLQQIILVSSYMLKGQDVSIFNK